MKYYFHEGKECDDNMKPLTWFNFLLRKNHFQTRNKLEEAISDVEKYHLVPSYLVEKSKYFSAKEKAEVYMKRKHWFEIIAEKKSKKGKAKNNKTG